MTTKSAASKPDRDPLNQEIDFSEGIQDFVAKRRRGDVRVVFLEGELARQFKTNAEVVEALKVYLASRNGGRRGTRTKRAPARVRSK